MPTPDLTPAVATDKDVSATQVEKTYWVRRRRYYRVRRRRYWRRRRW